MADTPERKQDLSEPGEEALEQRVREMLDLNEQPEAKKTAEEPKKSTAKKVNIAITHHDDDATPDDLNQTIASLNEQLADEQPATAPVLAADEELKKKPTPKKPAKKVEIQHFNTDTEPPEPEPATPDESDVEEKIIIEPEITDDTEEETIHTESSEPEPVDIPEEESVVDKVDVLTESPLTDTIDSAETDKAVSDIVATESDKLLEVEDATVTPKAKPKQKTKKRHPFKALFATSARRWLLFLVFFAAIVGVGANPGSRYYLMNAAGVRSAASVVVLDESSEQPLKNVQVTIDGKNAQTDAKGQASFTGLRLGPTKMQVEKRAFASAQHDVTIGWGSNPLADVRLKPTGSQLLFKISDYVSGQPVSTVEASLGEATAVANEKGEIKLTIDNVEGQTASVTFTADGYKMQAVEVDLNTSEETPVVLVPGQKIAFISKRTGTYDLYKVDIDGQQEELVLAGTGKERDDLVLAAHPLEEVVVLLSSRDGRYASNGQLIQTLNFVSLSDNSVKPIASATQIRLVDWVGSRIIYTQLNDDASIDDPSRTKLMSYDFKSGDNRQLAATNYFNDIVPVGGKIYYAPASAHQQGVNNGMFVVNPDASGKQSVFDKEVWNMFRTGYNELVLAVQQEWYKYKPGDKEPEKLAGQPVSTASRQYADSPDAQHSLRVDVRDGRPTLLLYKQQDGSESVLQELIGLKQPIRWISADAFVVRVVSDKETADYVMSIVGGEPKKITNVTDTRGIERWTY